MTERLYWHDPYLREFTARVVTVRPAEGGRGPTLELDRTAFYPTAGGQLHDTGTLDGLRVIDVVQNAEETRILHRLEGGEAGEALLDHTVTGRIDWERRFDHMQQHTGQHVLSQAALRELGAETLAVHLGADRGTVDLHLAAFDAPAAARLEDAANAAVLRNLPVRLHLVDDNEVSRWGLRRPPKKSGTIRLVEIEGFDRSACGGTHVRATGEIGAIAVTGWERYKGGTRVSFLCGWRALFDHRRKTSVLVDLGRTLSAGASEVAEMVQKLLAKESESARRVEALLGRLAAVETERRRPGLVRPAVHAEALAGRPGDEVRALAEALAAGGGLVVLLAADEGRLIFARSADLTVDVAALLRRILEQYGGKGGGTSAFAQGMLVPSVAPTEALETATRWAEEALRRA
ncbi:MAG: alanyl-tRNA editing protein [bacterium]